jgi:hypothetical protein
MTLSMMPFVVQLRQLQRQQLFAEAEHERLMQDADPNAPRPQEILPARRGRKAVIRSWTQPLHWQRCSSAFGELGHRPLAAASKIARAISRQRTTR